MILKHGETSLFRAVFLSVVMVTDTYTALLGSGDLLKSPNSPLNLLNSGSMVDIDSGYPHDGCAYKNPYPHDLRADKDYMHDRNNQCIILRLQLSFEMINVQLMLVSFYSLIFATNMC